MATWSSPESVSDAADDQPIAPLEIRQRQPQRPPEGGRDGCHAVLVVDRVAAAGERAIGSDGGEGRFDLLGPARR